MSVRFKTLTRYLGAVTFIFGFCYVMFLVFSLQSTDAWTGSRHLLSIDDNKLLQRLVEPVDVTEACDHPQLDRLDVQVMRSIRVMRGWHKPRIFCIVNTNEAYHKTRAAAVKATWLRRCDEYVFASNVTDPALPSVKIEHEGEESHENLWLKTRSMMLWLRHQPLYENYDWVLRADDDAYVIMDNLRFYLSSPEVSRFQPRFHNLVLGHVYDRPTVNDWFIAGSSFVMSAAAIRDFAELVEQKRCYPDMRTSADDYYISKCLKDEFNAIPIDTRDTSGKHRFHFLSAAGVATIHKWNHSDSWVHRYHRYIRSGLDCCSDRSISFHYVPPWAMSAYEKLAYDCREGSYEKVDVPAKAAREKSMHERIDWLYREDHK